MAVERGCSNILAASSNTFTVCDPVTLIFDLLTFDLILIGGRSIVMTISVPSLANFCFSCFGFIVRTDSQTESHTEADDRYTHATIPSA